MPRRIPGIVVLLLAAWVAAPVLAQQLPDTKAKAKGRTQRPDHRHDGQYMGRPIADVMSYLGADWLLRDTRIEEEQPDRMLDSLGIQPGMTIADVGAGVGYHSLKMAERVGPTGLVYATDVQPQMLRMLIERARKADISNVIPVLCTQDYTGLPPAAVDLILMVDVYHEMSEPEQATASLRKALKPGGRLVLVEFRAEDPMVPIKPEHKMSVDQVRREIEPQGFRFQKLDDFLPWQHILIFEKPAAEVPAAAPAPAPEP
jgi:ubiquinone/menaquinone biosynthesis C-methylase UbiE